MAKQQHTHGKDCPDYKEASADRAHTPPTRSSVRSADKQWRTHNGWTPTTR